jgi:hypothetical protein
MEVEEVVVVVEEYQLLIIKCASIRNMILVQ